MVFELGDGGDIIIDDESIAENTEEEINSQLDKVGGNSEDFVALAKLAHIDLPDGIDLDLSRMPDSGKYRIVCREFGEDIGIDYSLDELDGIFDTLVTLFNNESELGLIGGAEWRAIIDAPIFGGEATATRLYEESNNPGSSNTVNSDKNNNVEEIYRFIQSVKNIPQEDWYINDKIKQTGPIGINVSEI